MNLEHDALILRMVKVIRGLWDQYQEPTALTTLNRSFASRLKRVGLTLDAWLDSGIAYEQVAILYLRSGRRLLAPKGEWLALGLEEKKMLLTRIESRLKGPGGIDEGNPNLQRVEFAKTAFQSPDMKEFE